MNFNLKPLLAGFLALSALSPFSAGTAEAREVRDSCATRFTQPFREVNIVYDSENPGSNQVTLSEDSQAPRVLENNVQISSVSGFTSYVGGTLKFYVYYPFSPVVNHGILTDPRIDQGKPVKLVCDFDVDAPKPPEPVSDGGPTFCETHHRPGQSCH